jgi:hypothetical protein
MENAPEQEKSNKTKTSIEFKPLEYDFRLLAYIDVLGWSDLVKQSESDPNILKSLNLAANYFRGAAMWADSTRSFFAKHDPDNKNHDLLDVTHFSDTLVFSCPVKSFAASFFLVSVQQACHQLLCSGHYTRGAIVLGKLAHQDNVVVGPALIEAYKLERDVAKYPRIIVTPEAIPHINPRYGTDSSNNTYTYNRSVRLDKDGLYYVDILGAFAGLQNEKRRIAGGEEIIMRLVEANLARDAHDLGRTAKHSWSLIILKRY